MGTPAMIYPNNQGAGYAASVPMWQVTSPPVADALGRFPCDPSNPNAARPVYEVAPPVFIDSGLYPNDQSNPLGAIPVRLVAGPPAPDAYGNFSCDPALDSSARPMWVVSSATGLLPVYPSEQDLSAGARPIYLVHA